MLHPIRPGLVAALLAAMTTGGCATTLATLQPYETLKPGDFHAAAGMAVQIPVSQAIRSIRSSVEVGSDILEHGPGEPVTPEEWATIATSSFGLLLSAPYFDNEYAFRYGVVKNIARRFEEARRQVREIAAGRRGNAHPEMEKLADRYRDAELKAVVDYASRVEPIAQSEP